MGLEGEKKREKRKKERKLLISTSVKGARSAPRMDLAAWPRENSETMPPGDGNSLASGLQIVGERSPAVNRARSPGSKLSRLRLIEMSSHRISEAEGRESLRNVNEAGLPSGRWSHSGVYSSMPRRRTQKEHVGFLPGGPGRRRLCHLGSCQRWRLPGVDPFSGCHAGDGSFGKSPSQTSQPL